MAARVTGLPEVSLRAVTHADFSMLEAWLTEPHVRRWWGEPAREIAMISELMADPAGRCLIARDGDGIDFGYCQAYAVHRGDARSRAAWACLTPGGLGLDCFIGRPDRLGRGLGAGMVLAALSHMASDPCAAGCDYAFMDPAPENSAAIRAYRRAGLSALGPLTMPEGTVFLMAAPLPR